MLNADEGSCDSMRRRYLIRDELPGAHSCMRAGADVGVEGSFLSTPLPRNGNRRRREKPSLN